MASGSVIGWTPVESILQIRKEEQAVQIRNMIESPWEQQGSWKYIELSGKHLGVRVEAIPPGGTSSIHHYHSQEEEHVLLLEGSATLVIDDGEEPLKEGDHVPYLYLFPCPR